MTQIVYALLPIVITIVHGLALYNPQNHNQYTLRENLVPLAIPENWDSVFTYTFDYERLSNFSDIVTRRINFRTTVHVRQDPENVNAVLAFFVDTSYDHEDAYHRNKNFIQEIDGIELPFRIIFYRSGLVHEIATDVNDSDLSARYKKTFASLIQFDWKFIEEKRLNEREFDYVFRTPETTIFGNCDVLNNVTQIGEGRILRKRIIMDTCQRELFPDREESLSDVTIEFKFRSNRLRQFHYLMLNGTEFVPESDSYSRLEQLVEFRENIKSRFNIHQNRIRVNRIIPL